MANQLSFIAITIFPMNNPMTNPYLYPIITTFQPNWKKELDSSCSSSNDESGGSKALEFPQLLSSGIPHNPEFPL